MKKLLIIIAAIVLAIPMPAQTTNDSTATGVAEQVRVFRSDSGVKSHPISLRLGVSGYPSPILVQIFGYGVGSLFGSIFSIILTGQPHNDDLLYSYPHTPVFTVEGMYYLNDRFSVGADIGFMAFHRTGRDKTSGEVVKQDSYSYPLMLLLAARYDYVSRPAFRLYGSVELGDQMIIRKDESPINHFAFQVNPLGVEFGRRLYGLLEIGSGTTFIGGRVGIGYRF